MMTEMIHMSNGFLLFRRDGGVGQGWQANAWPPTSRGERAHASSSGWRPRFLRIDSPFSSMR
jgi:hypothetical protein